MNRLDKFDEILDGYKGRKCEKEVESNPAWVDLVYEKISRGHEDENRIGLLVGKIFDDGTHEITDVVIPHQTSTGAVTLIPTYEPAIKKAKSKGDIVGTVFYNGPHKAFFSSFQLTTMDLLHNMQKVPKFSVVINKQKIYLYRAPEK